MGQVRTEDLIGTLAKDLRPVRRMAAPGAQAALWLAGAAATIGIAVALHGVRHDLIDRLMLPQEGLQWLASVGVGVTAAIAAAMQARPDRLARWALLPLPFLVVWLTSLGLGCLADIVRIGEAALQPAVSGGCIRFILGLGLPLAAGLMLLLRHAGPVRPGRVLVLAGLASAALCSAGLSLFHHLDASLEILISHGLAIGLVALLGRMLGWSLLMRAPSVS